MKTIGLRERLLKDKTESTRIQLFRYFFSGVAATIVDIALLYILTEFVGFHYSISAVFAFISGVVIDYIINIKWVFYDHKLTNKKIEFASYIMLAMVGGILNIGTLIFLTENIYMHYLEAKIIGVIVAFAFNFITRKYLLFSKKKNFEKDNADSK